MSYQRRQKWAGFTLIELMIVMFIVLILMGVGIPSYRMFVLKSQRMDAITEMTEIQAILERCYAQTFAYNRACTALPAFPRASSQGYYSITLSNQTTTTYTLTATPVGTQAKDKTCVSMTVNQTNQRNAVDSSGTMQASCWNP